MDKNNSLKILYLILFLSFTSCFNQKKENKDFYFKSMGGHDIWRLPIIEPYELSTTNCCRTWTFSNSSEFGSDFKVNFSVDSVNYTDNSILIYSPGSLINWSVLDVKSKSVVNFDNHSDFALYAKSKGFTSKLYSAESVYQSWKETCQLPWGNEILKKYNFLNRSEVVAKP